MPSCAYSPNQPAAGRLLTALRARPPPTPAKQGHPHVAVAAVHGHEAVLDLLCAAGGGVSLKALHHAADMRSLRVRKARQGWVLAKLDGA